MVSIVFSDNKLKIYDKILQKYTTLAKITLYVEKFYKIYTNNA